MACILKFPSDGSPGVLTITDRERDKFLPPDAPLRARIAALPPRWLVGLHHNWHDLDYSYDPLFAFNLAGEHDLKERTGRSFLHVPLDAANFTPPCFFPSAGERHWDLLMVARAVYFKEIPESLRALRALLDAGHRIRTLIVCPVSDDNEPTNTDVESEFRRVFSAQQQGLVTLLTFRYRYPFPLDLETLAHFYRSAKVFVYFAPDERRPRNVAYAWASGMPVVARRQIGLMLPEALRRPPYFYEFGETAEFVTRIPAILAAQDGTAGDFQPVAEEFSTGPASARLVRHLQPLLRDRAGDPAADGWSLQNLGIRIARHHGLDAGHNALRMSLPVLVDLLADAAAQPEVLDAVKDAPDPERALDTRIQPVAAERRSLFRRWRRAANA